ncbi:MAG: 2-amino-4-hydroxy-6-hydroxymethyldihydropteridine diphosphokinase [Cyanobacteria bacterium P01_F01_bin.150]
MSNGSTRQRKYLVGIGSNIDANKNVPLALEKLRPHVSQCVLSRAIQTEPVGIVSDHKFLNMIAYLECELDPIMLKGIFNGIEADLGRDRSDPLRKVKDRTIDLDILIEINTDDDWLKGVAEAPDYCRLILFELLASLPHYFSSLDSVTVPLQITSARYGYQPASLPT